MHAIDALPAFNDNYIWLISQQNQAAIVDPGDADVVISALSNRGLHLTQIIVTHWHPDHIGGIEELMTMYPNIEVIGPSSKHIPLINVIIQDNQTINILGLSFKVLAIPGHTLDHMAYYCEDKNIAFVGDTLFAGGCGRMFEGDPAMFSHSLKRLANLPAMTAIYCAHEYTLSNLAFAAEVEPDNVDILNRIELSKRQRDSDIATVPFLLHQEWQTNPFVRLQEPDVIDAALKKGALSESPADIFAALREWKNKF